MSVIALFQRKVQNARGKYWLARERMLGIDIIQGESVEDLNLDPARSGRYPSSGNKFLERVLNRAYFIILFHLLSCYR